MKHHLLILLVPFVLLYTACSSDDEGGGEPPRGEFSIAETAQDTEGLTVLNSILSSENFANLRNQLATDEYTLLAPNDAAFQNLLTTLGISNLGLIDLGILSDILSYHIIPNKTLQIGQLDSSYITLSRQVISVSQQDSVNLNANVPAQPATTIVSPNPLFASNGVVHVIDEVLLPPSLQSEIDQFGTVAGLMDVLANVRVTNSIMEFGGLEDALADETRNITVIAPIDGFQLGESVDVSPEGARFFGLNQIIGELIDVASPPRRTTTLAGVPVFLSVAGDGIIFINGQPVTDVEAQASNGKVLLNGLFAEQGFEPQSVEFPTDVAGGLGAIAEATGRSFSIFQAALSQTELTLDGEKTIFAPTDSAFIRAGLVASIDSAARIDNALLAEVLNNHIVDGVSFSTDLEPGALTTLSENEITITIAENQVSISDTNADSENARFVFFDEYVFFGNPTAETGLTDVGVIHAIDELLLP